MISFPKISDILEISYRRPMRVRELLVFPPETQEGSYFRCPRCKTAIEREYIPYCGQCGQRLDWSMQAQAKVIYIKRPKKKARAENPDLSKLFNFWQ